MKKLKIILFSFMMLLVMTSNVYAGEFAYAGHDQNGNAKWMYSENGSLAENSWIQHEGKWYYAGSDGVLLRNTWFKDINGKFYYLGDDWTMFHDTTTPDGFYVGSDGVWVTETQTTSPWLGTFKADDDQIITVKSVDDKGIQVSFYGYSEEGWNTREYSLQFTDAEKKKAVYVDSEYYKEVYTLTDTGIEIAIEPAGGWAQGTYVKQN